MLRIKLILICIFIYSIAICQNNKPVANPGGPYYGTSKEGVGIPVILSAYGSYDPDSPDDSIVKYKWDTDGDGLFGADDTDGSYLCSNGEEAEGIEVEVVYNWFPGETFQISLIVEDNNGELSLSSQTTISIRPYGLTIPLNIHNVFINDTVKGDALFTVRISHPHEDAQLFDISVIILPETTSLSCFDSEGSPVNQLSYAGDNVASDYEIYFNSKNYTDASGYQLKVIINDSGSNYEEVKVSRPFGIKNGVATDIGGNESDAVRVFPVPAHEFVIIDLNNNPDASNVSLINMFGNVLVRMPADEDFIRLNLKNIAAGPYYLVIGQKNNSAIVKSVIIGK